MKREFRTKYELHKSLYTTDLPYQLVSFSLRDSHIIVILHLIKSKIPYTQVCKLSEGELSHQCWNSDYARESITFSNDSIMRLGLYKEKLEYLLQLKNALESINESGGVDILKKQFSAEYVQSIRSNIFLLILCITSFGVLAEIYRLHVIEQFSSFLINALRACSLYLIFVFVVTIECRYEHLNKITKTKPFKSYVDMKFDKAIKYIFQ